MKQLLNEVKDDSADGLSVGVSLHLKYNEIPILDNCNSNRTFITINLHLLTDSKVHNARNQRL